jgi:hypothetical protein
MSHILSHELLADLAFSVKTSKILSGLIVDYYQSWTASKTIPIATMTSQVFLAQQGLYVSSFIHQIIHENSNSTVNTSLESLDFDFTNNQYERTFVHINPLLNSQEISLNDRQVWGELLIAQLTNSNSETDLADWSIWTDDRGYLYFQPTNKALSTWLKILFWRTVTSQKSAFFTVPGSKTAPDALFHYVALRCNQMQKLAESQINPWSQGEFHCHQTAELALIHAIIQVYDSMYMGAKYKILAAGNSLVENFLHFDRTCRLLDLDPQSPAFHERAGLIAIVRSAIRDLLANQADQQ